MTDTPQTPSGHDRRPNRLGQAAAVVGIVAGLLFIVAVIFFSGLMIGAGHGYHNWGYRGPSNDRPTSSCPMMGGGGMMRPGGMTGPGGSSRMMPTPSPTPAPRP